MLATWTSTYNEWESTHSRMGVQATDMDAHANQWAVTHKVMGIHTHLLGIQTQVHGDPQV